MKLGVLLVSRNNAPMIREWASKNPIDDVCVLNLDESTQAESSDLCREACSIVGVHYRRALPGGMVANLRQAADFFEDRGIDWILYMHHDAYPEGISTLRDLSDLLGRCDLSEYGVIGFNIIHGHEAVSTHKVGSGILHTLARSPLELGDGWYRPLPSSALDYTRVKNIPFAVESVLWSTALVSCKVVKHELDLDSRFVFFHAWDDIAFQLMMLGRYNITIPYITFMHNQMAKVEHGLPLNSPIRTKGGKSVEHFYGRADHLVSWFEKWNFQWDFRKYLQVKYIPGVFQEPVRRALEKTKREFQFDPARRLETVARVSFNSSRDRYKGTLVEEFYNHDPNNGPLKYFYDLEAISS